MKREIFATILITVVVLRGLFSTIIEVEEKKVAENPNKLGYSELVNQDLIFNEEFDKSISTNWKIEDGVSKYNRLSVNQAENIELTDNGSIKLTTKQESDGSLTTPYMTVDTNDFGDKFSYGYYEAKIKFTNHNNFEQGLSLIPGTNIYKPWGAFWLYPLENGSGKGAEVDIVENGTIGKVSGSIHEMNNYAALSKEESSVWFKGKEYNLIPSVYHRYGVYIEPNKVEGAADYTFYVNGKKLETVSSTYPLSTQTIHLSMEIADENYTDGRQGEGIDELDNLQAESMIVDYVKVYEYNQNI